MHIFVSNDVRFEMNENKLESLYSLYMRVPEPCIKADNFVHFCVHLCIFCVFIGAFRVLCDRQELQWVMI